MSKLLELAERCEAATGPDLALNDDIARARKKWENRLVWSGLSRPYTASIDAAMTLVPEGWLLQRLFERNASGEWNWRWLAELWRPDDDRSVTGIARKAHDNPAAKSLALCAAALRARASIEGETQ